MVAIRCTALKEECPFAVEDSVTVFALQVRLLEDEHFWRLWLTLVTPFPCRWLVILFQGMWEEYL